MSLLENEVVFVTNDYWRYDKYRDAKPDYYCIFDSAYFDANKKEINEPFINGINELQNYGHKPQLIVSKYGKKIIEDYYHWNQWAAIYYVDAVLHYSGGYAKEYNITKPVPKVRCVIQYAMMIATYMGFDKIYLLGIEQTNILDSIESYLGKNVRRYAFEITDEKSQEACDWSKRAKLDSLLFACSELFHHYELVYNYCIKKGIDVYNCTPESLVDCIPKIQYESLFERGI